MVQGIQLRFRVIFAAWFLSVGGFFFFSILLERGVLTALHQDGHADLIGGGDVNDRKEMHINGNQKNETTAAAARIRTETSEAAATITTARAEETSAATGEKMTTIGIYVYQNTSHTVASGATATGGGGEITTTTDEKTYSSCSISRTLPPFLAKFAETTIKQKGEFLESSDVQGFREYPPRRYYGLKKRIEFLMSSKYIFGKWPILLESTSTKKITLMGNPKDDNGTLPPQDGTNPSLLSVEKILRAEKTFNISTSFLQSAPPQTFWVASLVFKHLTQCTYQDSLEEMKKYRIQKQPPTSGNNKFFFEPYLLFLGENFEVLAQRRISITMDDPRLFLWKGTVYVSNTTPANGWHHLEIRRLYLGRDHACADENSLTWSPKGRNMAVLESLEHPSILQLVSWPDPLTVLHWDNNTFVHFNRPWLDDGHKPPFMYSPIVSKAKSSHFHGTNGFMVYLPKEKEFLGIAHRHRESQSRVESQKIASYGHHYTHAFFTINAKAPYFLKKISQEFVFPSSHYPQDADLIQFASGLEIDIKTQDIIISYGINDCESAITRISMATLQEMLEPVEKGNDILEYTWSLSSNLSSQ